MISKTPIKGNCPDCGKQILRIDGRYGEFYGCSGFPKCKWSCNELHFHNDRSVNWDYRDPYCMEDIYGNCYGDRD